MRAAAQAQELHYAFRFNAFMGVRSDDEPVEETGVEWSRAAAKPVPDRLRELTLAAAAGEVCQLAADRLPQEDTLQAGPASPSTGTALPQRVSIGHYQPVRLLGRKGDPKSRGGTNMSLRCTPESGEHGRSRAIHVSNRDSIPARSSPVSGRVRSSFS